MIDRLSLSQIFSQGVGGIETAQSQVTDTQNQLSSGKKINTPSDDPIGAARMLELNQTQSVLDQYTKNNASATASLENEDTQLNSVNSLITTVRTLAVKAGDGTLTQTDRQAIAAELNQRLNELVSLANSQSASGEYVFGGYKGQQQPFTQTSSGTTYQGDEGQRLAQVSSSTYVPTGDSGKAVFVAIPSSYLPTTANAANTGNATISSGSVVDQTTYAANYSGTYTVKFTAANAYQITDAANNVVSTGAYTDGQEIQFNGVQMRITGTPATGDTFTIAPPSTQDMFTTVQKLADGLTNLTDSSDDALRLQDLIAESLDNLDSAQSNIGTVRAQVGARLNTLTSATSLNSALSITNQQVLSSVRDVDYTKAASDLSRETLVLQAAQQSFAKVSGLSLFNYLK